MSATLADMKGFEPKEYTTPEYSLALGDEVCTLIACGNTVAEVERALGFDRKFIYKWAVKHKEFCEALIRARTQQAHALVDKAYVSLEDHIENGEAGKGRHAVEAYLKIAGAINPTKYGVRHVEHSGEIKTAISKEEKNLRILELLAKANPELFKKNVEEITTATEPLRILEDLNAGSGDEPTLADESGFFSDTEVGYSGKR